MPRPLPWSPEEQDIAVRVRNLEAAKTIVGILERHAEGRSSFGKFRGEFVRVWGKDEGIPPHLGIALWVRQRRRVFVGLDEDLRSVAAEDGEKRASVRLLESRLKAKLVAVKSDGLIDVADDEEWRNRRRRWSRCGLGHRRLPSALAFYNYEPFRNAIRLFNTPIVSTAIVSTKPEAP